MTAPPSRIDLDLDLDLLDLYLVRHGETEDNARRVFQGQGGKGLNDRGRRQAALVARRLEGMKPVAIVASDLDRAVETARIIGEACGLPIATDAGLREIDVGTWTGQGYDAVARLYPDEWAAWDQGLDIRRGGGETYAELGDRMDRTIARVATRLSEASTVDPRPRLVLVSHGGAIKSWIARILGVSSEGLRALAGISNTGITRVERVGPASSPRHRLHTWNDVAHLEELLML